MRKRVWIMNHYATSMYFNEGGRHYWFAKELKTLGYEPVIFCCNTKHNAIDARYFEQKGLYGVHDSPIDVRFVVVESSSYIGNGARRVKNMAVFAKNLVKAAYDYAKCYGRPDIILASSVHPLTVFAGEKIAQNFGVPCICEIRDLWPESIFAYYPEKRHAPYAKLLLAREKKMYEDADAIVMTWAGGAQYIRDMGWEDHIPLSKVHHICNGVDLEGFRKNVSDYPYEDDDLSDSSVFKVVYAGAIRRVNKVEMLVDVAEILKRIGYQNKIKILIWGAGDRAAGIEESIAERELSNIAMKGAVNKRYIPSILSQADCCILQYASTELDKFGQSQNKYFEYLASGNPTLKTYRSEYSIIEKYGCGIELDEQTPENIAAALIELASLKDDIALSLGENAKRAVAEYDFKVLTKKLVDVIEGI